MQEERWAGIEGYPDYEVSDLGRVRRVTSRTCTKAGRVLSTKGLRAGYPSVDLCLDGSKKTHLVHILVAAAFVRRVAGKPEVNHANGVKTDARASNLEWSTSSENQLHAFREGLQDCRGEKNGQAKLTPDDVREIRRRCGLPGRSSYAAIAADFDISDANVRAIVHRRTWTHVSDEPRAEHE